MKLAITGGTGFVGSETIRQAVAAGNAVRALTRSPQPAGDGIAWTDGSLTDPASLVRLVSGADAVIHIAGVVRARDAAAFDAANVDGSRMTIDAAQAAGVRRFIHVSSLSAREPQLSAYGASKARAEAAVKASGLDWTIVRPPAVYGPADKEMLDLFKMAKRGFMLLPPPGKISVIHVADLARLLLALAADATTHHATLEPDDGQSGGWDHAALARAIGAAVNRPVRPFSVPKWALGLAARGDSLVRRDNAKLTPDRAGYLAHPDWTISAGAFPPVDVWQPQIATPAGLAETAAAYRAKGWL